MNQTALRRPTPTDIADIIGAFLVTGIVTRLAAHVLPLSTAAAWLFLPAVLLVSVRWGLVPGVIAALIANGAVLTFVVPPIGEPYAADPRAYLRLSTAVVGMLAAVLTTAELDRRRRTLLAHERDARIEAETLAEIARRVSSSLDMQDVLDTTAESAHRLVNADVTAIVVLDEAGIYRAACVIGNRTDRLQELVITRNAGMSGQVAAGGRPLQIEWERAGPLSPAPPAVLEAMAAEGIISSLAVPIRAADEVGGVFWIHSRTHRDFRPDEITLLGRLAGQTAVAIANSQAHAKEQEARAEVEALLSATASLGIQAEPEEVLRTLVEQAARLLVAERALYAVMRDASLNIPAYFMEGRWVADGHDVRPEGMLWSAWRAGGVSRTNYLPSDPRASPLMMERFNMRSQLAVPLADAPNEHFGLVALNNSRRPDGFSERDERLLVAICETGAAVMRRARGAAARVDAEQEAARRGREVEALLAAADQLNSAFEAEEVLPRIASIAADLLAVERSGVATNEGDHALLRHIRVSGTWSSPNQRLDEESIAWWVIRHNRAYRSDDLTKPGPRFFSISGSGTPANALAVPIVAGDGAVLGALQLFESLDKQPFTEDDERLAVAFSRHAAAALERAMLLKAEQRSRAEVEGLVEELREREDVLRHQADTDSLTGLPNRSYFLERLDHAASALSGGTGAVAVISLDLDGFKVVNDSLGHGVGDEMLVLAGRAVTSVMTEGELVARFGGDEFAILVEQAAGVGAVMSLAERAIASLESVFSNSPRRLFISASAGVAHRAVADGPVSAGEMMREADVALYRAKAAGRAQAVFYTAEMGAAAVERHDLQTQLQSAVGRDELRLLYQPIVDLLTGASVGAEALLRWQHPTRGQVEPQAFIPLAEETGLILSVGRWALGEACRQMRSLDLAPPACRAHYVSVNLSARQFEQVDLVEQISALLHTWDLQPEALQLEITETAVIKHPDTAIAALSALKRLGVRIAIDDFGTGYSSLSYLRRLPVDALKIDQSFVHGLDQDGSAATLLGALIAMAHALQIGVTSEGIETDEQLTALRSLGCDFGQGFLFSPLLTCSELAATLTARA